MPEGPWGFYEFFAGGGMARLGLGSRWSCLFANEYSRKKAEAYRLNFGPSPELLVEDVWNVRAEQLPGRAVLSWGSFPCQDLSLAGNGAGLEGARSGTFVPFWNLMDALAKEGRAAPLIVLENVTGALSSNGGSDFRALVQAIASTGYRVGALVMDAVHFLPQSRPRLFFIAVRRDIELPNDLVAAGPDSLWHPEGLTKAERQLPVHLGRFWTWWRLPHPPPRISPLAVVIEDAPEIAWHSSLETERLLAMMSEANLKKVAEAQACGRRIVGTVYKRIRTDEAGVKRQRAEVRFDQISGCLRTPAGGSSRQIILLVEGNSIRSRLLAPTEAARLMGLPQSYRLPSKYNDAYRLLGDGVAVPAVAWLEQHLLRPLALSLEMSRPAYANG